MFRLQPRSSEASAAVKRVKAEPSAGGAASGSVKNTRPAVGMFVFSHSKPHRYR